MNKRAIYPGSFDPFTNGHLDIVRKASALFDEVYVVIGVNGNKRRTFEAEGIKTAMEEAIREAGIHNVTVFVHNGLTAEFAQSHGIRYMIRGLRNNMDYNYEENIAEVNKLIYPGIEYIYFRADNVAVSSSMVKDLHAFRRDISRYVPAAVHRYIEAQEG